MIDAIRPVLAAESPIVEVERLQTDRSHRDARRAFFVEGVRNVIRAVGRGYNIEAILQSDRLLTVRTARQLVRECRRSGIPVFGVSPEEFRKISKLHHASGVGAIVSQRWSRLHSISPKAGLCWIVLERVRSPGNLGSLMRTSESVGGAGFILVGDAVDPHDPAVVRGSMGSIFGQDLVRTDYASLRHWLRRHRCRLVGASPDGEHDLHRFEFPRPTILLLGEERKGIDPRQRDLCPHLVRIPMVGWPDSLNLAVAGGLLVYEVFRARSARVGQIT